MSRNKQEMRVLVALDGQPLIPSWKIWVGGDSVYAAARMLGGVTKLSLHPDVWLSGFTSESGQRFDHGGRISHRWEPAAECAPGLVRAATLAIARLGGDADHPPFHETDNVRRIEWLDAPPIGSDLQINLWLSTGDQPPAWADQIGHFDPPFTLPDDRFVWITVHRRALNLGAIRELLKFRDEFKVPVTHKRNEKPGRFTMSIIRIGDRGGVPSLRQMPLSALNFVHSYED